MSKRSHLSRTVLGIAKLALGLVILWYLYNKGGDAFAQLKTKPIYWPMLAAALVATLVGATLGFIRWHMLIIAVGIQARLIDSLRLGALGFALNFVSLGSIGGDFFKAIFLAHGQPNKRTEAIATIVADRVMGLLTLLLIATIGILVTGLLDTQSESLRMLCRLILIFTVSLWIGSMLLLFGGRLTGNWFRDRAHKIPVVGKTIVRLLHSVEAYRNQLPMLAAAFGVSLTMLMIYTTSFYLVARGLPMQEPSLAEHMVIVPCAALVGALPLTPSGLGTMEYALDELYKAMPGGVGIVTGDGALVGLGRRVTDIAVALVGLVFYLSHRREVSEVYAEAEEYAEKEDD